MITRGTSSMDTVLYLTVKIFSFSQRHSCIAHDWKTVFPGGGGGTRKIYIWSGGEKNKMCADGNCSDANHLIYSGKIENAWKETVFSLLNFPYAMHCEQRNFHFTSCFFNYSHACDFVLFLFSKMRIIKECQR